jgi:hypothetical protein
MEEGSITDRVFRSLSDGFKHVRYKEYQEHVR